MIDFGTGHELIEVPVGFYDVEAQQFLIVEQVETETGFMPLLSDPTVLIVDYQDGLRAPEVYDILFVFNPDDLTTSLVEHAARENYEDTDSGSSADEESGELRECNDSPDSGIN